MQFLPLSVKQTLSGSQESYLMQPEKALGQVLWIENVISFIDCFVFKGFARLLNFSFFVTIENLLTKFRNLTVGNLND